VCVPGGFCPSGFFHRTVAKFEAQGYPVHAIDLSSVGSRKQGPASPEDDAEHIRSQVRIFADQSLDVVLVGNSYGGWVITEAAKGISKADREAEGKPGGLIHMVYLASPFSPKAGISVQDLLAGSVDVPTTADEEGYVAPPPAEPAGAMLASSVSKKEQLRYGSMLKHFSDKVHHDKLTYLGYEHVPSTAIITTKDTVVNPKWQRDSFELRSREAKVH
jgi:pimeloyl-ACP methyl ester carboxylesterase